MALTIRSQDPIIRWGMLAGAALALVAAWVASVPLTDARSWLVALWVVWLGATVWVLSARWPSLALAGLQVFLLLEVLAPATLAVRDGRTMIARYDLTTGTVDALRLAVLVQMALVAGAVGARAWRGTARPVPVHACLPARRLDRWAITLLAAALAGMALYVVTSRGDPRTLVVLVGTAKYGEYLRTAEGPVVQYFKVMLSLAGVAMMVAALRLTSARSRSRLVPWVVIAASAAALVSGGARWWLGVPAVGAVLVWWKTTSGVWARRPRRVVLLGAAGLFAMAVLVGGLRDQAEVKTVETEAFLDKQLRGGVFATTAALVETVPEHRDHLGGASYTEVLTMPVPRAVWPDKPEGEIDALQAELFDREIGASFAFYGEAYANFGWVGAVIICFGFGALLESTWLALAAARTPAGVVAGAAAVPVLLQLFTRGYLAGLIAGMFGFVVGVVLVVRGLRRMRPHEST